MLSEKLISAVSDPILELNRGGLLPQDTVAIHSDMWYVEDRIGRYKNNTRERAG